MRSLLIASLAFATTVYGHTAPCGPFMWCANGTGILPDPNNNMQTGPTYNMTLENWWTQKFRGCDKFIPPESASVELPALGRVVLELSHNCGQSTWSFNGDYATEYVGGGTSAPSGDGQDCISDGLLHTSGFGTGQAPISGSALAIYYGDIAEFTLSNTVVFSVNATSPYYRLTEYQVPNLPNCPVGGCLCMFSWIPSGCGCPNMVAAPMRCHVTGATSTVPVGAPRPASYCGEDLSKCNLGAKEIIVYNQQPDQNGYPQNVWGGAGSPPGYFPSYGFSDGAQDRIFTESVPSARPANELVRTMTSTSTISTPPAATPTVPATADVYDYIGCYADDGSRTLDGPSFSNGVMTNEVCAKLCKPYKYFGTENSYECYCGTEILFGRGLTPGLCTSVSPDGREICGGNWKLSMYQINPNRLAATPAIPVPTPQPTAGIFDYQGCYANADGTGLDTVQWYMDDLNNDLCAASCESSLFIATDGNDSCNCGDALGANTYITDDDNCNHNCPGENPAQCGGGGFMSVYKRNNERFAALPPAAPVVSAPLPAPTIPVSISGWEQIGCWSDADDRTLNGIVLNAVGKGSLPGQGIDNGICANLCNNFQYAGTEDGTQCFCSDTIGSAGKLMPDSDCNIRCTETPTEACGGAWRLTMWNATSSSSLPSSISVQTSTSSSHTSTLASNTPPPSSAPKGNINLYACVNTSWGAPCQNLVVSSGSCLSLKGTTYYFNMRSAGPDTGSCTFYAGDNCNAGTETYGPIVNPGVVTFGNQNAHWGSVTCSVAPPPPPPPPPPAPKGNVNLYACVNMSWGAPCQNLVVGSGSCLSLKGTTYYHNMRSAGPDNGSCTFYAGDNCDAGTETYGPIKNPGVDSFGNQNAHWGSVNCSL